MYYNEIMEYEKENQGRVFLHLEEGSLVAYELSAYVVKQLFPHLRLSVLKNTADSLNLLRIVLPLDPVLESAEYPLSVSNNYIEMQMPGISSATLAAWKSEYEDYKENK